MLDMKTAVHEEEDTADVEVTLHETLAMKANWFRWMNVQSWFDIR